MNRSLTIAVLITALILIVAFSIVLLNNSKTPNPSPTSSLTPNPTATKPQHYKVEIVKSYPHDPIAFTEGLIYAQGFLFESTGLNGESTLRRVNLTSGEIQQKINLSFEYFGEGLTIINNTLIQLTYRSHTGFVYDKDTFTLLQSFSYPNEGWGLTNDGKQLIMSDGSDKLIFLNPETYQKTGQIQVLDKNASINNLNELEYINGKVYANIWLQQKIAIIDPQTGQVEAWIDLSNLKGSSSSNPDYVLNGIAYDTTGDRLFVTGKDWPELYEIKLVPST